MSQPADSPVVAQAHFQCTYEDFREASLGHVGAMQGANRQRLLRALLAWILFALVAFLYAFLLGHAEARNVAARPPPPAPTGWPLAVRFAKAAAPALILFIISGWATVRAVLRPPTEPWMPKRTTWRDTVMRALLGIVLAGTFFVVMWSLNNPVAVGGSMTDPVAPSTAPRPYEYALALSGWVFLTVLAFVLAAVNRGPAIRERWERQLFLHRAYTLEASDNGLVLNGPQARLQYRWEYFPGFRETDNLLLLYVSPYGFWPIPKRGFTTIGSLEAFKGLLMTHVRNGTFLPSQQAFPVLLSTGQPMRTTPAVPPPIPRQPPAIAPLIEPGSPTPETPSR